MYFYSNTYNIMVRKFQKVLEGLLETSTLWYLILIVYNYLSLKRKTLKFNVPKSFFAKVNL